jgi:hypothetical protein
VTKRNSGSELLVSAKPSPEQVRAQVEKILASRLFTRSERLCRFLRFCVEQTLDEKGDQLKEQLVGVEVFDRKGDYDPRTDPIVRVEAMNCRRARMCRRSGSGMRGNRPITRFESRTRPRARRRSDPSRSFHLPI